MNSRRKRGQFVPTVIKKSKLVPGSKCRSSDKDKKDSDAKNAKFISLDVDLHKLENKVEDLKSLPSETVQYGQLRQDVTDSEDLIPNVTKFDSSSSQCIEKVQGTDNDDSINSSCDNISPVKGGMIFKRASTIVKKEKTKFSTRRRLVATPTIKVVPVAKSDTNLINSSVLPEVNLNPNEACEMEVSASLDQASSEKPAVSVMEDFGIEHATATNPCSYSSPPKALTLQETCDSLEMQGLSVTTSDKLVKNNDGIGKAGQSATAEIDKCPPIKKRRIRGCHVPKLPLTKNITSKTNPSATTECKSQDDKNPDADNPPNGNINLNASDNGPSSRNKDYSESKINNTLQEMTVSSAETSTAPQSNNVQIEQTNLATKQQEKLFSSKIDPADRRKQPIIDLVNPPTSSCLAKSGNRSQKSNGSEDFSAALETVSRPRITSPVPLINITKSKSTKKRKRKHSNKREAQQISFEMLDDMKKGGKWKVDCNAVTFSHIIHINPPPDSARQMGIRERERIHLEKIKNIIGSNDTVQSPAQPLPQPTTGNSHQAPQLLVNGDGVVVIDPTSLQAPQPEKKDMVHVLDQVHRINQNSFRSKPMKKRSNWTKSETETFYEAIRRVGIDFSTMKILFMTREKDELQRKYKMENKKNPNRISEAVKIHAQSRVWDDDTFKPLDVPLDEEPDGVAENDDHEHTELSQREAKTDGNPALMPNITASEQVLPGIQNIFNGR